MPLELLSLFLVDSLLLTWIHQTLHILRHPSQSRWVCIFNMACALSSWLSGRLWPISTGRLGHLSLTYPHYIFDWDVNELKRDLGSDQSLRKWEAMAEGEAFKNINQRCRVHVERCKVRLPLEDRVIAASWKVWWDAPQTGLSFCKSVHV